MTQLGHTQRIIIAKKRESLNCNPMYHRLRTKRKQRDVQGESTTRVAR